MTQEKFNEFKEIIDAQFEPAHAFDIMHPKNWSSMQAMIVVTTIDEHYDVLIENVEMKSAESLEALFNVVQRKLD